MKSLLPLLALLSLLTPSPATPAADPNAPAPLSAAAGEWHLRSLKVKGEAVAVGPDAKVTLSLDKAGQASGQAPVNRYFGTAKQDAQGKLSWTPFGSTQMAGPEPMMKLEGIYYDALAQTTHFQRKDKTLTLSSADGKTQLEFAAPEQ